MAVFNVNNFISIPVPGQGHLDPAIKVFYPNGKVAFSIEPYITSFTAKNKFIYLIVQNNVAYQNTLEFPSEGDTLTALGKLNEVKKIYLDNAQAIARPDSYTKVESDARYVNQSELVDGSAIFNIAELTINNVNILDTIQNLKLSGLTDVNISNLLSNQFLIFDGNKWVNSAITFTSNESLSGLTDVNLNNIFVGDVLIYDGSKWINSAITFTSNESLSGLTDVNLNNIFVGDVLIYDGSKWVNSAITFKQDEFLIEYNSGNTILYLKDTSGNTKSQTNLETLTNIGNPRDGVWNENDGLLSFTDDTKIGYAINDINLILGKLAPSPPANLSTRTLSLSGVYSAREQNTGTIRNYVTDDTTPTANVSGIFGDGSDGVLTAYLDTIDIGNVILHSGSNVGIYGALNVIWNDDLYSGQTGKSGFWFALNATITTSISPSNLTHIYKLTHSKTGSVPDLSFWIDNPLTPTISAVSYTTPSINRYISGVPSLANGQILNVSYIVNNSVGYFYNQTRIATITSSYISSSVNSPQPYIIPNINQQVNFSAQTITVANNVYGPTFTFAITPYNSKNTSGTVSNTNTNIYIDTTSNETVRTTSYIGEFPTINYGNVYVSTKNIKTEPDYIEELQMVNNRFIWPVSNFSTYSNPTIGPNYSTGMGSNYRWVCFNYGNITEKSTIQITFNTTLNFAADGNNQTTNIKIYAKVDGAIPTNGWIDCNLAYPGVGNPTNNGDASMIVANSTATIKRFTFGSIPKTGNLYIRIGYPSGSNKSFLGQPTLNIIN